MILDTCALLCFAQGGEMLYAPVRKRINSESTVFVSAISGFEIGVKHQKGKLELPAQPSDWLEAIPTASRSSSAPSRPVHLHRIHTDPCERLIIATAEPAK